LSSDFVSLALAKPLLRALADEGYTQPTPIQAKTIPVLLQGRDVLGCAQTGTGKTAAFALPLLHRLLDAQPTPAQPAQGKRGQLPRVLVLAPTRELATQIVESFATYGRYTLLKTVAIFGGVSQYHQVRALERGVDILVATPGRLIDLMQQRLVRLDGIQALVLDEADRMLDMGFIEPIRKIVAALSKNRHTLLFSATMPKEIMHLADALLRDPVKVAVTPVASAAPMIEQSLYFVDRPWKQMLLEHVLEEQRASRAVVFTKTKHGADRVARKLAQHGISADAIHGNKAQNRRTRTLDRFRNGSLRVLVATDVAARGLDVDGVSHVINYDLPMEPEAYVHRIGRTGRAGASGIAVSFCDREEVGLLRQIERLTKSRLPERDMPKLAERAMRPSDAYEAESDEANEGEDLETRRDSRSADRSQAPRRDARGSERRASSPGPRMQRAEGARPDSRASSSQGSRDQAGSDPRHTDRRGPANHPNHAGHQPPHHTDLDSRGQGHGPTRGERPSREGGRGPVKSDGTGFGPKKQHRKGQNRPQGASSEGGVRSDGRHPEHNPSSASQPRHSHAPGGFAVPGISRRGQRPTGWR
jgi:ATP-dependent RNA helicase RhlE